MSIRLSPWLAQRNAFRRALLGWYSKHGRDLPWRHTRDPYAILVSELMLQQTQVATVIPCYSKWLRRFPDFESLAAASESDVLHAWQGLGYYARARNLHAAAKIVVAKYGAVFPSSTEESRQLPGLGRYTANAVATFAFDESVPIVEANIGRLLARLLDMQVPIDSAAGDEQVWSLARALVPKHKARIFNSALMDFGALICVARQPKCDICSLRSFCRAVEPARLPLKKKRAALKTLIEHHALVSDRGRILLEQSQDRWRGMWILPRLTNTPSAGRLVYSAEFPFTHHRITLRVSEAFTQAFRETPGQRSFAPHELDRIPIPSPHRRALTALLQRSSPKNN